MTNQLSPKYCPVLTLYYFVTCVLLSGLAIYSRSKRPADYKWTKPQPVAWMLVWAVLWLCPQIQNESFMLPDMVAWIVAGLMLGLLGDIFLLSKRWFVPGFLGFVLGHLAYIIGFARLEFSLPLGLVALLCVPGIAYASLISRRTHSPKMLPFVWIYMIVISSMLITSVNVLHYHAIQPIQAAHLSDGSLSLVLGALLFCISDGFWSWNKFVKPLGNPGLFILGTYYSGQALIAFGALRLWQLA